MTVPRLTSLAALLVAAGLVVAQPPAKKGNPEPKKDAPAAKEPPKPAAGSLEDTLDKALRNSADIKSAEAKVRNAEAELNQVRQQVLMKATAVHGDLNIARRMLAFATKTHEKTAAGVQRGLVPDEALLAAQMVVEKHRGEVEKLETELKSLRGEFAIRVHDYLGVKSVAFSPDGRLIGAAEADGAVRVWDIVSGKLVDTPAAPAIPAVQAPMLERVQKLLDQEVTFDVTNTDPVSALQGLFEVAKSDIPVRHLLAVEAEALAPVTLRGKLRVGACIQAIEDSDYRLQVVVRDYGLLLTTRDRVPDGAPRAEDVWKGNRTTVQKAAEPKGK